MRRPMIGRWLHRAVASLAFILVVSGSAMFCAGTAWAAAAPDPKPVLLFDNAAGVAKLVIPTPSCSAAKPKCRWMLYMNLPLMPHEPLVGYVTGTHGVLVLRIPKYCGEIQADALEGPSPWVYKVGIRESTNTWCEPTTTTTTTTTTTRPRSTTTTTVAPKVAASTTSVPATVATTALPFTEATSTSSTQPATAQLPFTGLDFKPLAILGSALVILGGLMLSTVESRRRMLRRATAIKLDDVKDGARRTSSWFLGQ